MERKGFKKKIGFISVLLCVCLSFALATFIGCGEEPILPPEQNENGLVMKLALDGTYYVVAGAGGFAGSRLIIPEEYNGLPVTAINQNAFKGCANIASIYIPDTVTNIGKGAFRGCTGVRQIRIPFTGESRGARGTKAVFGYIFGSKTYTNGVAVDQVYNEDGDYITYFLPRGLKTVIVNAENIAAYSFNGVSMVTDIVIDEGVKNIDGSAFDKCASLTDLYVCSEKIAAGLKNTTAYGGLVPRFTNLHVADDVAEESRSQWLGAMDVVEHGIVNDRKYTSYDYRSTISELSIASYGANTTVSGSARKFASSGFCNFSGKITNEEGNEVSNGEGRIIFTVNVTNAEEGGTSVKLYVKAGSVNSIRLHENVRFSVNGGELLAPPETMIAGSSDWGGNLSAGITAADTYVMEIPLVNGVNTIAFVRLAGYSSFNVFGIKLETELLKMSV